MHKGPPTHAPLNLCVDLELLLLHRIQLNQLEAMDCDQHAKFGIKGFSIYILSHYLYALYLCQTHKGLVITRSIWKIIPKLEKKMIAHRKWGFEFLWRNIGSLVPEEMEASSCNDYVGGCIIAHTPGTGKYLMIISLLQLVQVFQFFMKATLLEVITQSFGMH